MLFTHFKFVQNNQNLQMGKVFQRSQLGLNDRSKLHYTNIFTYMFTY